MAGGMEAYLRDLLDGRFVEGYERTYDPRNPRHHFCSRRNAVKLLRATQLLPWFTARFPGEYLLLVRHPVPTALSRARNGWAAPLEDFIAQEKWFEGLSARQRDFVRTLARNQEESEQLLFRRHLVTWCLEHAGVLTANAAPLLHYEHLITQPDAVLPVLAKRWQVPDRQAFLERFYRPSRSAKYSREETKSAIGAGDRREMLEGWKSRVGEDEIAYAEKALSLFGITSYRARETMPTGQAAGSGLSTPKELLYSEDSSE